jgi:tetratricopeptide (TPR) repeat protein
LPCQDAGSSFVASHGRWQAAGDPPPSNRREAQLKMAWWKFWDDDRHSLKEKPDYYEEGVQLARQDRLHDALTSFRLALKERSDDVASMEQMAVIQTRMGLPDDAAKMYERALEHRPGSASAHYGLAFVQLNRGEIASAVDHLERFLDSDKPGGTEVEQRVDHARATLAQLRGGDAEGEA